MERNVSFSTNSSKIKTMILCPFLFKNMPLYFILILTFFYLPQEIYGAIATNSPSSHLFLSLLILAILSYLLSYWLFKRNSFENIFLKRDWINLRTFSWFMTALYCAVIVYSVLTAKDIPLFAAFRGEDLTDLAYLREDFLRTRTGNEIWLRYIYTLMVFAVIPFILTRLFVIKHKLRFIYLIFFVFTLSLSFDAAHCRWFAVRFHNRTRSFYYMLWC